jgi:hypothetical protein
MARSPWSLSNRCLTKVACRSRGRRATNGAWPNGRGLRRIIAIVVLPAFILLGCTSRGRTVEGFQVLERVGFVYGPSKGMNIISASCHPGEQMLGGGYNIDFDSEEIRGDLTVEASYPSTINTWTLNLFNADTDLRLHRNDLVGVVAYCLTTPDYPVGMQVIQSDPVFISDSNTDLSTIEAHCPAGSTVTSGGFFNEDRLQNDREQQLHAFPGDYNDGIWTSAPLVESDHAVGWMVKRYILANPGDSHTSSYALCSAQNLTLVDRSPTNVFTEVGLDGGPCFGMCLQVGHRSCDGDEFSAGGGFEFSRNELQDLEREHYVEFDRATDDLAGWGLKVFYSRDVLPHPPQQVWASALCLKVPHIKIPPHISVRITSPPNGAYCPFHPWVRRRVAPCLLRSPQRRPTGTEMR